MATMEKPEHKEITDPAAMSSGYYFGTLNELSDDELRALDVTVQYFQEQQSAQLVLSDRVTQAFHDGVVLSLPDGWTLPIVHAFEALRRKFQVLEADIKQKDEQLAQLQRMQFGKKSEKTPPTPAEKLHDNVVPIDAQKRRKRSKSLPDELPRDVVVHEIPIDEQKCNHCGGDLHQINNWKQESEQLVVVREHVRVRRHIQMTYGCRCCEAAPVTASKPPSMIPGSTYDSPEFLAYVVTRKYQYALPLYRLEQFFEQAGVSVSRSTIARLLNECVDRRLTSLYELLKAELRSGPVIHADETTIQVLKEPGRRPESKSYLWAYATALGTSHPVVIFDYTVTRGGAHAREFLTDGVGPFSGVLVCDGFKGYNGLKNVTLAGCWAHARRKFEAVLKLMPAEARSSSKAQEAFGMIGTLYAIERRMLDHDPAQKLLIRQAESKPIIDNLQTWLRTHQALVPPESGLGRAISYTLNEWGKLMVFLQDGRVPIDNNEDERQIRHFAIGRKNWLFADSTAGGYTNAVLYSLVRTAIVNRLDPYEYLKTIFEALPAMTTVDEVRRLLPWNVTQDQARQVKMAA